MDATPSIPLLAVDIGNSSIKFGFFEHRQFSTTPEAGWVISSPTNDDLPMELITKLPEKVCWLVGSVQRRAEQNLKEWVDFYRRGDTYRRLTYLDLPLTIHVDFPDRVGVDRLCAAMAANQLRSTNRAAVVIGAGSAMTIDLVSPDGAFEGGTILAGFRMCAEALAAAADLLPLALLEPSNAPPALPGKNTEAAIRAGLFWGAVGAAREMIARYAELYPDPEVFVSGGDLTRLAPLLHHSSPQNTMQQHASPQHDRVQFIPHLVLMGIALASQNLSQD